MEPQRYGPFPYTPIIRRPEFQWPGGKRLALWVIPNIECFALDAFAVDPRTAAAHEVDREDGRAGVDYGAVDLRDAGMLNRKSAVAPPADHKDRMGIERGGLVFVTNAGGKLHARCVLQHRVLLRLWPLGRLHFNNSVPLSCRVAAALCRPD